MSESTTVTVRFEYANHRNFDKIFYQPLFFMAMNLKQYILKQQNKPYHEGMLNEDIIFILDQEPKNIKLEMSNYCMFETDKKFKYIMDRYLCSTIINYQGVDLIIKTDNLIDKKCIKVNHNHEYTNYSAYEITYNVNDFHIFEDFLKTSLQYYEKYYDEYKIENSKIKLYLISNDGSYFDNFGSRSKRDLSSVFLPKQDKDNIIKTIENFISEKTKKRYAKLGINHKLIILLEGVPGTGKSSLITALASHFNYNLALLNFTPKMNDSSLLQAVQTVNNSKKEKEEDGIKKMALVIEDIDCIFQERKSNDEHKNMVTFSGILNAFDGIASCDGLLCFMSTNHIERLDKALIRPGRVDYIMKFGFTQKEEIIEMFKKFTEEDEIYVSGSTITQDAKALEFNRKIKGLGIKLTTSLLQQYMLKYVDNSNLIIENVDELVKMYNDSLQSKGEIVEGQYS